MMVSQSTKNVSHRHLFFLDVFILFVYLGVEVRGQLAESVLSFSHLGLGDWTLVLRLGGRHRLPTEPLRQPHWPILFRPGSFSQAEDNLKVRTVLQSTWTVYVNLINIAFPEMLSPSPISGSWHTHTQCPTTQDFRGSWQLLLPCAHTRVCGIV